MESRRWFRSFWCPHENDDPIGYCDEYTRKATDRCQRGKPRDLAVVMNPLGGTGVKRTHEWHCGKAAGEAEPFLAEMLARIPRGVALDVAAGRGRNALALARVGHSVVAVDYSAEAMRLLAATAREARLAIWPIVANLDSFHLKDESFDAIVNINFLDRALFPNFVRALRPGGVLIADTFLVDQAAIGHPRDPRFLLAQGELRTLAGGLDIEEYREGPVTYPNGERAFRASILARRSKSI
jgi:tellurite methyltransferase